MGNQLGPSSRAAKIAFYVAAYLSWLLSLVLAAGICAVAFRGLTNLYVMLGLAHRFYSTFAFALALVLGIAWLVVIVFNEHYLSHAETVDRLRTRIVRLLLAEGLVLGTGYLAVTLLLPNYLNY